MSWLPTVVVLCQSPPSSLSSALISPSQEKEVRIRQKMSSLRHKMEDKLEHWEEKSKDFIGGFLGMFGRDGRLVSCGEGIIPNICTVV